MPIMDNPFLCSNGHSFKANAKIRARCPNCGAMARRDFRGTEPVTTSTTEEEAAEQHNERHKPIKHPIILRQGRTPMATAKKRSPAQLANDKRLSEMRRKATGAKPSTAHKTALGPRVANGLVKTRRVTKPSIPAVNKRPKRTAVAGQLRNLPSAKPKSFMDQVIDNFKLF